MKAYMHWREHGHRSLQYSGIIQPIQPYIHTLARMCYALSVSQRGMHVLTLFCFSGLAQLKRHGAPCCVPEVYF